jgi:WD40 repeat protein
MSNLMRGVFAAVIAAIFSVAVSAQTDGEALIAKLKTPDRRINTVAYSPDGKLLAAGYGFFDDGGITIWNTADNSVVATPAKGLAAKGGIERIQFDKTGKLLAALTDKGDLFIWTVGNWKNFQTAFTKRGDAVDMEISPDGTMIAVALESSAIVYNVISKGVTSILSGKQSGDSPYGIAFTPDSQSVVVSSSSSIAIWSVASKSITKQWNPKSFGFFGKVSDDGRILISGGGAVYGEKSVSIWNLSTGTKIGEVSGFRSGLFSLGISHSGKYFAVGGGTYGSDGAALSLWTVDQPTELAFTSYGDAPIQGLAFSPDDRVLAVGDPDGFVRLYKVSALRGAQVARQSYALCGEVHREEGDVFLVPISKVPHPMRKDFEYNWKLRIANPETVAAPDGTPISLDEWSIESFAADDRIRVAKSSELVSPENALKEFIVFGDVQNPGWDTGSLVKIYANGTFVSTDNPGKCIAKGSLSQFKTDFLTVKQRLLDEGLLDIQRDPLTLGADHYRTRFITISEGGKEHPRSDADDIGVLLNGGPAKKREAFNALYLKEQPFIELLITGGTAPRKIK